MPHWGKRDFGTIQRGDVIRLLERIVTSGKPILANRVQALISKIFGFALDVDLLQASPCARLRKRGAERVKTRTLTDLEIRLFWDRVIKAPVPLPVGLALRLVLMTGCRPGEVAGMACSELESEDGTFVSWTIPSAKSKNGHAHFVPLSAPAAELIEQALQLAGGDSELVFRSGNRGSKKNYTLAAAMQQLCKALPEGAVGAVSWRADPPTPHDLRKTAATRLAAAGVSDEDISAILNHVRSDVTRRHYNLYDRADEKRRALERWALVLKAILNPPPPNAVHHLFPRKAR